MANTDKKLRYLMCSLSVIFSDAAYADNYDCSPSNQVFESGIASYYGSKFHGNPTKSGEIYNMHAMTAAHNSLPMGTIVHVTNTSNQRTVQVRINDTGGFGKLGRVIDLSQAAAEEINMIEKGVVPVDIRVCDRVPVMRPVPRPASL